MSKNSKYESREVISARIIEITLKLLLKHSPDDLTLRQIATHAKCHHPDIVMYFKSKSGLYREVFTQAIVAMSVRGLPLAFEKPSLELIRLVRLAAWIEESDKQSLTGGSQRSLFDALKANYMQRFNLDQDTAQLLTQRLLALVMAAILHPTSIGLREQHFTKQFALETKIATLLAQHQTK